MNLPLLLTAAAVGYLPGSIPAGYIAGRIVGVDIRQHGSGNIGATNVLRVLGRRIGYAVFLFDVLKGFTAARCGYLLAGWAGGAVTRHPEYYAIVAAVFSVIGHSFPVWLRFRGGKGVATSVGALLGLVPIAAVIVLVVWYFCFQLTRYVSLASMIAAGTLPLVVAVLLRFGLTSGVALLYFAIFMAVLVLWRHRSNMSRLLAGTEPRFERR